MKVTYNNVHDSLFSDVKAGSAFRMNGQHYMKTEPSYPKNAESVNAVNIQNGSLHHFADSIKVEVLDVELIVKC